MRAKNTGVSVYRRTIIASLLLTVLGLVLHIYRERGDGIRPHIFLVPKHHSRQGELHTTTPVQRSNTTGGKTRLNRILYLHVPKSGSSVANLLVQYACPGFPKDISIVGPWSIENIFKQSLSHWIENNCYDEAFSRFSSGHSPLPRAIHETFWESNHVVTFLRDPNERIISGFLHNFHTCDEPEFLSILEKENVTKTNYSVLFETKRRESLEIVFSSYWKCVQACAAKMILGFWCGNNFSDTFEFSTENLQSSISRMLNFSFVGVTEDCNGSVQRWQDRFGGNLSEIVYQNMRPSPQPEFKSILRQLVHSMGLEDSFDSTLVSITRSVFNRI